MVTQRRERGRLAAMVRLWKAYKVGPGGVKAATMQPDFPAWILFSTRAWKETVVSTLTKRGLTDIIAEIEKVEA